MGARQDLDVVVCGGGRTGHLNAVLFKQVPGVRVSLLTTRQDVIAQHHASSESLTAFVPDAPPLRARLDAVGAEASLAAQADLVVLTVPAHVRAPWLRRVVHALPRDKPVYVGAIPGFCGFDWLAEQILAERPNAVIWGMKDVPHTAFDLHPGVSVRMGGAKQVLHVGTHARETPEARAALQGLLQRLYAAPVHLLDHFLEITLTPGNPIMHSSVVYGLAGPYSQWHGRAFPAPVCWWSDCTELGAYFLQRSDEECQRLCQAVQERLGIDLSSVKPLHQEIVEAYGDQIRDPRTLLSTLRTNQAYDAIEAPMAPATTQPGYVIDKESRAFQEDVAYGLAVLVEMGRRLDVPLPYIQEIFDWNVGYMQGLRGSALDYFPSTWPACPAGPDA